MADVPSRLGVVLSRARGAPVRWPVGRLIGFLGVVVVLSSCRIDMAVRVESDEFGAGRVSVTAALDRDVAAALLPARSADGASSQPTPPDRMQLDDLRKAGWEGPGLVRNADRSAQFALSHRFSTVREANALLDQLSGPSGPLADLELQRTRSPFSTTLRLSGPGDFRAGLASFGDAQIATVTGNGPLGLGDAELIRQAGAASIDEVFALRVDAQLIDSTRTWKLPVGKATPFAMQASSTSWGTIGGGVGALGAAVTLLVLRVRSKRSVSAAPAVGETA